ANLSCAVLNAPQCCYSDWGGRAVTGVSGRDAGHIHCGSGSLTPPVLEPWRSGWPLMPSYGGWLGSGAVCPLCQETASSEAETGHPLEGRSAVLERGGDAFAR